ncbi:histone-lysine N-methyltransferase 2D-like [Cherax quadricarinatus]
MKLAVLLLTVAAVAAMPRKSTKNFPKKYDQTLDGLKPTYIIYTDDPVDDLVVPPLNLNEHLASSSYDEYLEQDPEDPILPPEDSTYIEVSEVSEGEALLPPPEDTYSSLADLVALTEDESLLSAPEDTYSSYGDVNVMDLLPPPEGDALLPPQASDTLIPPPESDTLIPPPESDTLIPPPESDVLVLLSEDTYSSFGDASDPESDALIPPPESDALLLIEDTYSSHGDAGLIDLVAPPESDALLPPSESDAVLPPPESDTLIPPPESDALLPSPEDTYSSYGDVSLTDLLPPPVNDALLPPPESDTLLPPPESDALLPPPEDTYSSYGDISLTDLLPPPVSDALLPPPEDTYSIYRDASLTDLLPPAESDALLPPPESDTLVLQIDDTYSSLGDASHPESDALLPPPEYTYSNHDGAGLTDLTPPPVSPPADLPTAYDTYISPQGSEATEVSSYTQTPTDTSGTDVLASMAAMVKELPYTSSYVEFNPADSDDTIPFLIPPPQKEKPAQLHSSYSDLLTDPMELVDEETADVEI